MALPQFLLNLLFPPRCPFCDRPVEAVVSAPCPHCLGSDVWLEGAQAVRTYLPGTYDLITWVPVSPKTLRRRGYDQAQLLAQETARALAAQAVPLLEKTRDTPPQSSLTQGRQRRANVAGGYTAPHPAQVAGQRVLLLDDILTTGATLNEAARTLRQAGARQVVAAAFCRTPPKNP